MEKIINLDLEQPKGNEFTLSEEHENMELKQDVLAGSKTSKFKTEQDLFKAYESLEKEFTKKCQQLKQLENQSIKSDNAIAPQYMQADWQEKVNNFFEQNPNAKNYVEQISECLSSDKVLASSQNSLEQAYNKVLAQNFKSAEQLINDKEFVNNYVLQNEEIKQIIINDYLAKICNDKQTPLIMNNGGAYTIMPNSKPKTLQEANKLATYCLK